VRGAQFAVGGSEETVRGCAATQLGKTDRADDPVFQAGNLGQRRVAGEAGNVADDWDDSVLMFGESSTVGCPGGQLGGTDDWDVSVPQRGKTPSRAWTREGKANRACRPTGSPVRPDDVGLLTGNEIQALEEEPTDPLQAFADAGLITDVMNRVKSGKEATVYC